MRVALHHSRVCKLMVACVQVDFTRESEGYLQRQLKGVKNRRFVKNLTHPKRIMLRDKVAFCLGTTQLW